MKRDTVKTIAGVIVIAAIVVATYLYGNHQRQNQVKQENASNSQTASPSTSATAAATSGGGSNTAPVTSVKPNTIQGGTSGTPTPTPTLSPTASEPDVSVSQGSVNSNGTTLADTGSGATTAAEMAALVIAGLALVRSRRAVLVAQRVRPQSR